MQEVRVTDGGKAMVILLTGYNREDEREEAAQAGVDAILSKPVEPERLYEALGRMIRK